MIAASFDIRPATDIDRRKLLAPLAAASVPSDADVLVAFLPEAETLLGAGGVWFKPSRTFPEQADCLVQVGEVHRRKGIGRGLVDRLTTIARECGAKELRARPMEQSSVGFQFALACGFQPRPATISYEAPMEDYSKAFGPIYETIVSRGRMPAGARVIPLSEANREEVCRLVMDNLGFPFHGVADRLRGTESGYSQTISRVALLDGRMVGATLMTYQGAMATVDGTAVLPNHRNTWVNAALKYHVMQELIARGVKCVRFSASESQHRDTANFARRIRARVLSKVSIAVLNLNPGR